MKVREMKANHGFPTQPPAPSEPAARSRPPERLPYLANPVQGQMLTQVRTVSCVCLSAPSHLQPNK